MRSLAAILFGLGLAFPAGAVETLVEVDAELLILADVSSSMSPLELEVQRRGFAEALSSVQFWTAIRSGRLARIAVSYVEWAEVGDQRVVIDWRLLDNPAKASAFATEVSGAFDPRTRRTSISDALVFGALSLDSNGFRSDRRIINISGDGPNNQGLPVLEAREKVLARDITINGLPLLVDADAGRQWRIADLDAYYRDCVIGGPGAFLIPVRDWRDFATAVRRKLVLELAAGPGVAADRPHRPPDLADCLIGEKIWNRMMSIKDG